MCACYTFVWFLTFEICLLFGTQGWLMRGKVQRLQHWGSWRKKPDSRGKWSGSPQVSSAQTLYLIADLISCAGGGFRTDFYTLFIWITVTCLDPGLSNCTTQIILVNINGDEAENINPTQQLGEHMGLFYVRACPFYSMGAYMGAGEDVSTQTSKVGVEILLLVN